MYSSPRKVTPVIICVLPAGVIKKLLSYKTRLYLHSAILLLYYFPSKDLLGLPPPHLLQLFLQLTSIYPGFLVHSPREAQEAQF